MTQDSAARGEAGRAERPGEDIRILAARRTQEPTQEGRERLTQAMRELL